MKGNCNCLCGVVHQGRPMCNGGGDCIVVVDVDPFVYEVTGRPAPKSEPVVMCGPCADDAEGKPRTVDVIRFNSAEAV